MSRRNGPKPLRALRANRLCWQTPISNIVSRCPFQFHHGGFMFSITEFCAYVGISRALFYRLQKQRVGPAETRIGSRVLIAKDTAAAWLKAQEKVA
jgi:predicted DNA-binding transcriptional regulator AlpA